MTLQIKSTDGVCGIPIMQIRGFFQRIVSYHRDSFILQYLREEFSLDEKSATALASELVAQRICRSAKRRRIQTYGPRRGIGASFSRQQSEP
jgi:hypothetical protein